MRSMFKSRFRYVDRRDVERVLPLISEGGELYKEFMTVMLGIADLPDKYRSIPTLMAELNITPGTPMSKRHLYTNYTDGVVAGAGSGEDCVDLIDVPGWYLYDFEDTRMINKALGHTCGTVDVAVLGTPDGSTISEVKSEYVKSYESYEVITIDSLELQSCGIISADVEGAGFDVLVGATDTIYRLKPDVLMSIYHHWVEYLLIIPYLYEMGYRISVVRTVNMLPTQPHLELTVMARFEHD